MKKITALLLAVIMMFSLFGCSEKKVNKITLKQFDAWLNELPVVITNAELLLQSENNADKRFYPDMLTATFQNRTNKVLASVQLAFVAWDEYGKPVNIKAVNDEDGQEVGGIKYADINLESGRYYGKGKGIELASNHNIATFKVMVVRFKTTDGETWSNPYYDDFINAFVGKEYNKNTKLPIDKKEVGFKVLTQKQLE